MSRINQLLNLAQELETAELLLENHRYRACVSRSYYAMYYAVQALLASKLINSKTHKGVIQLFGQHFVKTGELSIDDCASNLSGLSKVEEPLLHCSTYEMPVMWTLESSQARQNTQLAYNTVVSIVRAASQRAQQVHNAQVQMVETQ